MAAETGQAANRVYRSQDGALHINGGAVYNDAEVDISGQLETVVGGTAAGKKVAGSTGILSTANPTEITTGLASVAGFSVCLHSSAAPAATDPAILTWDQSSTAGKIKVYQWVNSSTTGWAAGTSSAEITWVALGT